MKLRGHNPGKYAIALMDELFTAEEMASSNYMSSTRCSKPSLDEHRRHLIEGMITLLNTVSFIWKIWQNNLLQSIQSVLTRGLVRAQQRHARALSSTSVIKNVAILRGS